MSAAPLPPHRYRVLRARYNALLASLYERTSLTLREIATAAGRTDRAVQMQVRALGCRPRNARTCRPGTNVGVRRAGPKLPRLNAPATRRVAAAFAEVARELAASAQARTADELQRTTARAARRSARTQARVMTHAAREFRHLAVAIEHTAATKAMLARGAKPFRGPKRSGGRKPAKVPAARARQDVWETQQRTLREQEMRMWEAHQAAAQAKAAPAAASPDTPSGPDPDAERRINAIAARYAEKPRPKPQPRIRRL